MSLSGYSPTHESISILITETAKKIDAAMLQKNVAVRHNAFTDYCLALLMCATGLRPVQDPIQSQKYFDTEQGWMLISDKVVHEDRAWRIVALPKIACEQLKFYAEYLPRLAGSLTSLDDSKNLISELKNLIAGDEKIPYFFYLDEVNPTKIINITPSVMSRRWESYWKLPLNFSRHIAATELLHSSVRADWVQVQLGHIVGLAHPFGRTATESAKSILNKISANIEHFMSDLGWKALRSPVRSLPNNFTATKQTNKQKISIELGSDKRTKAREKGRQLAAPIVRQVLHDALAENTRLPTREEFNQILQTLVEQAYEKRLSINYCLRLLYRYVYKLKGGKTLLSQVARIRELEPEASPFHENSVTDYKNTQRVRQNFLDYLNERGKISEAFSTEKRITEIIFSAALFSGLADPNKLTKLSHALQNSTYQYEDKVFVDIALTEENESPVFRWFPDKISTALILGFYELRTKKTYSVNKIEEHLEKLSDDINLGKHKNILSLLRRIATAGLVFDVPGHLASCLTGNTTTVSLPLPQWVRFQSNLALQTVAKTSTPTIQDNELAGRPWVLESLLNNSDTTPRPKKLQELGKFSRNLFAQYSWKPSADGSLPSKAHRTSVSKELKEKFTVPEVYEWSTISLAIVSWTTYLCEHGTRKKEELALATIDKYTHMVIKALTTAQPDGDFFSFDESQYEEVYLRAIEAEKENKRLYLAGRLIEFHSYLVKAFSVEEPAWSSILSSVGLGTETSYADANAISEEEFLNILNAIQADSTLNIRLKAQYTVLLMLGYRFGLRSGEALRLKYIDVQVEAEIVCIIVRNSIFGETKSLAGVRTIPLLEKMSDIEIGALQKLLSYSEIDFETNDQALLMADQKNNKHVINRFTTIRDIGMCMKLVTGDDSLRFHHLRHSWATRMYSYHAELNSTDHNSTSMASSSVVDQFWQDYVGEHDCQYPLRSLATAIGHSSEITTLSYYVHSVAEANQNAIDLDDYSITTLAYSYALAVKHGTVRARIARENLFVISKKIPSPKVKLKKPPRVVALNKKKSKETSDLNLVAIDRFLKRFSETQKPIELLSYQLMLDLDNAEKALKIAARMERKAGFVFYRTESFKKEDFQSEEYIYPSVSFFNEENIRVKNHLKLLDSTITGLEKAQLKTLKTGLEFWRDTFRPKLNINIFADKEELRILLEAVKLILPEVTHTISSSLDQQKTGETDDKNSSKKTPLPLALEKTQNRKNNSIVVTFNPGSALKTNQTLWRLLFMVSVYLEYSEKA